MRLPHVGLDQAGWVRLDDGAQGAGGAAVLAAAVLDDAEVWATSWEGDRLSLRLLVPGVTGTVSRTSIVYHAAAVSGMPLVDVVRRSVLAERVELDATGAGRHRIWLGPEAELVISFADVELVSG